MKQMAEAGKSVAAQESYENPSHMTQSPDRKMIYNAKTGRWVKNNAEARRRLRDAAPVVAEAVAHELEPEPEADVQ